MRHATILNVARRSLGAEVEVQAQIGDLVLHLDDVADLAGFPAAEVRVGGDDPAAERVLYTSVDEDSGTLTLDPSTPMAGQWDPGTPVELFPIAEECEASCFVDGQVDGDALIARVPHSLEPLLSEGTRQPEQAESVWVEEDAGGWVIVDLLGQQPIVASGAIAWGGPTNDLAVFGFDALGEVLGDLNAEDPGFGALRVGTLISDSVAGILSDPLTFFVDPDLGADINDGSALLPLASVQEAIDRLPRGIMADCVIDVTDGALVAEALDFSGLFGSGSITLELHSHSTILNGTMLVDGCSLDIFVNSGTVDDDGSTGDDDRVAGLDEASVYARNSRILVFNGTLFYAHGAKEFNIEASAANVICQAQTEFHGATDYCVKANQTSHVLLVNCKGSSSGGAVLSSGSIVRLSGTTRPTGAKDTSNAGTIVDDSSGTSSGGASGGGGKHTRYWAATNSGSWRNAFGGEWRSDTDDVFQGQYGYGNHRGCWFYDYASIRSVLSGQTIDAAYLYVARRSAGGISGPIALAAWSHDKASPSGSAPDMSGGPNVIGKLAWGQARWLKIPSGLVARIRSSTGDAKGIGLYVTDGSPYGIFGTSGKLKVVYH